MNLTTVAVIVPIYKSVLTNFEKISLLQCFKVLSKHKIIAVLPNGLDISSYEMSFDEEVHFDNTYFNDIAGYNRLMLSKEFYERFLNYKFILIYQLDAFVFRDELIDWCNKGYDFIGAPWLRHNIYPDWMKEMKNRSLRYLHSKKNIKQPGTDLPTEIQFENRVGNGGFSLRNTQKFYEICIEERQMINLYNNRNEHYYNEDTFWAVEVNRKKKRLNIPNHKVAVFFSLENGFAHASKLLGKNIPFGCHAWEHHLDFWTPIFADLGILLENE